MRPYASWPFGRLVVGIKRCNLHETKKDFWNIHGQVPRTSNSQLWLDKLKSMYICFSFGNKTHDLILDMYKWKKTFEEALVTLSRWINMFLEFSNLKLVIFLKGTPNKEAVTVSSVHKDIGSWKTLICRARFEGSCITSIRIWLGSRDHPANQKHIRITIHEHQLKLELPESRLRYTLQWTSKHISLLQNPNLCFLLGC